MTTSPETDLVVIGRWRPVWLVALLRPLSWLWHGIYVSGPVLLLLCLWWLATRWGADDTLATPEGLVAAFASVLSKGYQGVPLAQHVLASLGRTLTGFVTAACLAVPLGLMMGMSPRVRWFFNPLLALLRPVPAIAFVPLFIVWFGIGEFSKVLMIFLSSFLYITISTEAAVYSIPAGFQRVALNLGANRLQLFRRVILPASLPGIMTGLKVGLAISWALVVAAELIAAQRGLGFMIMDAATFFRINDVYIGIICIGVIGILLNGILSALEKRICHWRGK